MVIRLLRRLKYKHFLSDKGTFFYLCFVRSLLLLGIGNVSFGRKSSEKKSGKKNKKRLEEREILPSEGYELSKSKL